jgi:endonuclease YncB( thermonuclease family)
MRHWVVFAGASLCALAAAYSAGATPSQGATVASVYDGDTLTLTSGERVRLVQIDTPELGSGECYSRAARTALLRLTPIGSRITLESDPSLDKVDRYGRILRYVRRGATNVNLRLVEDGDAAPYFYDGDRGQYAARLLAEAQRAKSEKRGLWGACPRTMLDPYRAVETGQSGPPAKPIRRTARAIRTTQARACRPIHPTSIAQISEPWASRCPCE